MRHPAVERNNQTLTILFCFGGDKRSKKKPRHQNGGMAEGPRDDERTGKGAGQVAGRLLEEAGGYE